uniref:Uncharacterized protein n=1 Tax=Ananas comosus var. bracteatus TaxID=296719 RepID=A0A6V7NNK7_ANACO|nr:unnamed protein product [Ananas comosus var. bracteatus]
MLTFPWIRSVRLVLFGAIFPDCALFAEPSGCSRASHSEPLCSRFVWEFVMTAGLIVHGPLAFAEIATVGSGVEIDTSGNPDSYDYPAMIVWLCYLVFAAKASKLECFGAAGDSWHGSVSSGHLVGPDGVPVWFSGLSVSYGPVDILLQSGDRRDIHTGGYFDPTSVQWDLVGQLDSVDLGSRQHIDSLVMCFDLVDRGSALYALVSGFGLGTGFSRFLY